MYTAPHHPESTNQKPSSDTPPPRSAIHSRPNATRFIIPDAVAECRVHARTCQCFVVHAHSHQCLAMDLIYMTDVMAYQSIRGPVYDKYNSYDLQFNNGQTKNQKLQKKNKDKEPCKICQERQRRSLMTYIRSKSHEHSDKEIKEEDEEEEAQEKQAQEKKEAKKR